MLLCHTRRIVLLSLTALGCGLLLANPADAALLAPSSAALAPAQVEGFSPYLPQLSCDPVAKPGTLALGALLLETYGQRSVGIARDCAVGGKSEHKEGRALDWMLDVSAQADKEIADSFLAWLLEAGPDGVDGYNARRLGVMYVIWNRQVWSSYGATHGWKPYSGPSPHTDHIHISLSWAGAMKRTSFWTGTAAPTDYGPCVKYVGLPAPAYAGPRITAACPAPVAVMSLTDSPTLQTGSTGAYVLQLQTLLKITADGAFGPRTTTAISAFQLAQALPVTGGTDAVTWARLRAAASSGAPTPGVQPSEPPHPAPMAPPTPAMTAPLTPPRSVPPVVPPGPSQVHGSSPALAPFVGLTLRQGARGAAVLALQRALHLTADGVFGPRTAAAVTGFNQAHRLPVDSVVRSATWRALGGPATSSPALKEA